jgi:hypothetical protein
MRRKVIIGIAVLAAAAFAGGAIAATQQPAVNARQAFLSDVAQRLHISPKQLTSAVRGAMLDELNTAVANHKLTKAQASAIRQRLNRDGAVPLAGLLGGFGGFGGFGGPGAFGGPRAFAPAAPGAPFHGKLPRRALPGGRRAMPYGPGAPVLGGARFGLFGALGAGTKYLGITPAKLLSELSSGKTLAQIATAQGKTAAGLTHAIVATRQALLNHLVVAKLITRASAAKRLARLQQRVAKLVSAPHPLAALLGPRMLFGPRRARWSHP